MFAHPGKSHDEVKPPLSDIHGEVVQAKLDELYHTLLGNGAVSYALLVLGPNGPDDVVTVQGMASSAPFDEPQKLKRALMTLAGGPDEFGFLESRQEMTPVQQAAQLMRQAVSLLTDPSTPMTRETAVARTEAQTAILWLELAERQAGANSAAT